MNQATIRPMAQEVFEWGGFTLSSNVALTRLRARPETAPPDLSFAWRHGRRGRLPRAVHARPLAFRDGTSLELLLGGSERSFRYELRGLGTFVIRATYGAVDFWPEEDPDPKEVEHFLVNAVLGIMAGLRGHVCLHAASVAGRDGATLIAGPSGAGKSTLAWDLVRDGHDLLADDYTVVRPKGAKWVAYPGSATMRLGSVDVAGGWNNRGKTEFFVRQTPTTAAVSDLVILSPDGQGSPIRAATSVVALQAGWLWMRPRQRALVWKQILSLVEATRLQWQRGSFESKTGSTASRERQDIGMAVAFETASAIDRRGGGA